MLPEKQQAALFLLDTYCLRHSNGQIAIDNIPGPAHKAAIKAAQKKLGIPVDGIWGPVTEKAVYQAIGKMAEPKIPEPVPETQDVGQLLWDTLTDEGLPPEAVAGILGNLDAESGLKPDNMEDIYEQAKGFTDKSYTQAIDDYNYSEFINDSIGYGLAQWTWPTRKQALLRYARDTKRSIGDPQMQAEFLIRELRQHYPDLLSRLIVCRDIRQATTDVLINFEQPLDQSKDIQDDRTERAIVYYKRYMGGDAYE